VLVCLASFALEKAKIDDPVGAVPVHFVNGIWGVLAVGIFASGNPDTAAWNGIDTPVSGLLYGNFGQFAAQFAEAASIGVVACGLSYVFFRVLNGMNLLRVSAADELAGLDMPEMGVPGYHGDGVPLPGQALPRTLPGGSPAPAAD
jgi:Amt family ammonium transporter